MITNKTFKNSFNSIFKHKIDIKVECDRKEFIDRRYISCSIVWDLQHWK